MHHVHAKVAGPRHPCQRVHVRAVHIEQRALGMQNLGNFRNPLLENSQRRGIGDHQRRNVCGHLLAEFFDVNLAVGFGLDVFDLVARDDRGCRIRSVRGVRNQDFLARIPLLSEIGSN